jgi:hypothetical protein
MSDEATAVEEAPEATEETVEARVLVIATDGNTANVVKNTMGLWESKSILESLLVEIGNKIAQTATPRQESEMGEPAEEAGDE